MTTGFLDVFDGRYFAGLWLVQFPARDKDSLLVLYRDAVGPWHLVVRARAYKSKGRPSREDEIAWQGFTKPRETPEEECEQYVDQAAEHGATALSTTGERGTIRKVMLRTDRCAEVLRLLEAAHLHGVLASVPTEGRATAGPTSEGAAYELPRVVELIRVTPEMQILDDTHRWESGPVCGFCQDCGACSDDDSVMCPSASEDVRQEALRKIAALGRDPTAVDLGKP